MHNDRRGFESRNYMWYSDSYGSSDRIVDERLYRASPAQVIGSQPRVQYEPRAISTILLDDLGPTNSRVSTTTIPLLPNGILTSSGEQLEATRYPSVREVPVIKYRRAILNQRAREELNVWRETDLPRPTNRSYLQASDWSGQHYGSTMGYTFPENGYQPIFAETPVAYQNPQGPPPSYYNSIRGITPNEPSLRESDEIEYRIQALDDNINLANVRIAQTSELREAILPCNVANLQSKRAAYYIGTRSMLIEDPPPPQERQSTIIQTTADVGRNVSTGRNRYRLQATRRTGPVDFTPSTLQLHQPESSASAEMAHRFHNYAKPPSSSRLPARGRPPRRIKPYENNHCPKVLPPPKDERQRVRRYELVGRERPQNRPEASYQTDPNTPKPGESTVTPLNSRMSVYRGMQPFTFDDGIFITPEIFNSVMEIYKDYNVENQGLPTFAECNYIVSLMKKYF